MALTFKAVSSATSNKTAGTTHLWSVTFSTAIAVGDLLVLAYTRDELATDSTAPTDVLTDDFGNTWTRAFAMSNQTAAGAVTVGIYYLISPTAHAASASRVMTMDYQGTGSVTARAVSPCYLFSGVDTTTPVQFTNGASAAGGTQAFIGATPTNAGDLVFCVAAWEQDTSTTITGDSDTTNGSWNFVDKIGTGGGGNASNATISTQYKVVTASGVQSCTITSASSADLKWAVAIFQVPSGPPPITGTVAQVVETDSVLSPIKWQLRRLVAQVVEADSVLAVTERKLRAVALVSETDTVQTITPRKIKLRTVAQVSETDSVQTITRRKVRAVALELETDTAQPIVRLTVPKIVAVAQVVETDSVIGGGGAIVHDATTAIGTNTGAGTVVSASHVLGAGADRLLVITVGAETGTLPTGKCLSVTYNGVSATKLADVEETSESFGVRVELWYLLEAQLPAAGTYTVVATWDATPVTRAFVAATSVTGAKQGPADVVASIADPTDSTTYSKSITSTSDGSWIYDGITGNNPLAATPTGSGQTLRTDQHPANSTMATSTTLVPTAGAITLGWSFSGSQQRAAYLLAAWAPAGAGITARKIRTVAQVVETDTAQPITRATPATTIVPVAQVVETDTALAPVGRRKARTVALELETDTVLAPIVRRKIRAVALVLEADAVQTITARRVRTQTVAQVVELDSVLTPIGRRKARTVALVSEADSVLTPIARRKARTVALVSELDAVLSPIVHRKRRTTALVSETDSVFGIVRAVPGQIVVAVAQILELDSVQTITRRKRRTTALVLETDTVLAPITPRKVKTRAVALVVELDSVQTITRRKRATLLPAVELDEALAITRVTGGRPNVWTGTAWVAYPVAVWTGTAWVRKPLKVWTGTAWESA